MKYNFEPELCTAPKIFAVAFCIFLQLQPSAHSFDILRSRPTMGRNQSVPVQPELEEAVLGFEGGFPNIFGKHSELCMFAHVLH